MTLKFVTSGDKKKLMAYIEERFGISKIPGALVQAGQDKVRVFTGSLTREEMHDIDLVLRIELAGLYAFKHEQEYRISFDSLYLFENQMTSNVVEINSEEVEKWMRGLDLEKPVQSGVVVIKYKEYFLGCGKSNGTVIFNYVPKDRRFKK